MLYSTYQFGKLGAAADRDMSWDLAMVLGLEQDPCRVNREDGMVHASVILNCHATTLEQPAPIISLTQWW